MTHNHTFTLAKGVVAENMGDTVLVMIPGQTEVLRLTGPAADVVTAVTSGHPVSDENRELLEELGHLGVITTPMSRRSLLRVGAIGAGAGVAVLAMPSVAAAASLVEDEGSTDNDTAGGGVSNELFVSFVGGAISSNLDNGGIATRDSILVAVRRRDNSPVGISVGTIGDLVLEDGTDLELLWDGDEEAFFLGGLNLNNDAFTAGTHTLTFPLEDGTPVSLSFRPADVSP